jgi:cysteine desulfurase
MVSSVLKTTPAVYFDCNATTPVLPIAAQAALSAMEKLYGNPSSTHITGLQAKYLLETTRRKASKLLCCQSDEIIFTSGATEAIQMAVFSALYEAAKNIREGKQISARKIVYAATEHKAVPMALQYWKNVLGLDFEIVPLSVNSVGQVDLVELERLAPEIHLLCTMAVNNETGTIQDLARIDQIFRKHRPDGLWLVDCVQAFGKIPLHFQEMSVDYACFSGHKLYGPKGVGFLFARVSSPFHPLIVGGGQERGLRSGTENLPGVAALGALMDELIEGNHKLFHDHSTLEKMRQSLIDALKESFPRVVFNTSFEISVPTTINFSVPGVSSKEMVEVFDAARIRVSAGSACSSAKAQRSYVLDAMGLDTWRSESAIRLSIGPATTHEEIERGIKCIQAASSALQASCLLPRSSEFHPPESLRDGLIQLRFAGSNTWILAKSDTRETVIIDPVPELSERITKYVECQGARILAILDTHSHADHDSCRPLLQTLLERHMIEPQEERDELGWPVRSKSFVTLADGNKVPCILFSKTAENQQVLARVATPGHTSDSISFLFGNPNAQGNLIPTEIRFAFLGDTILSGGLGRTNFKSSSESALFHTLKQLDKQLPSHAVICPAHDYDNSFALVWDSEKKDNPLLAMALDLVVNHESEFVQQKKKIDLQLSEREKQFQGIVCGVVNLQRNACQVTIPAGELPAFLSKLGSDTIVVDVREPSEFDICDDWENLGFDIPPRNVPLSRFVNFMAEMAQNPSRPRALVFLCLSGSRSLYAAKTMRRNGFENSWNVEGGVAYGCLSPST